MNIVMLSLAAAAAAAQPMTAGEFLNRAEPLMKKSKVTLMFSSEARTLIQILGQTAARNRDRIEAERAAGKQVSTCLPPKGKASVDANELLAYLRALPAADRAKSLDEAFRGYAAHKYPCRA